jgi:hypothetical protein
MNGTIDEMVNETINEISQIKQMRDKMIIEKLRILLS